MIQNSLNSSIEYRNKRWLDNPLIPSWVDIDNVGLDQFFTPKDIAKSLYEKFLHLLSLEGEDLKNFTFVEPSAGDGSFFDLLPKGSVGIDIAPLADGIIKEDFLSWSPKNLTGRKLIFIGNPPFGYRGWLALSFMNHAAIFADYIAFILPMSFQSDGKGSPKNRVNGMFLMHSEVVETNAFYEPGGRIKKVNALWQIWKRGPKQLVSPQPSCSTWLDLFTVDMRKERLCGQERLHSADFFLQRTYYKEPPQIVKDFSEVKYVCGYGLIIKKDKRSIVKALKEVDWREYSNLAAHNCRHISMYHIEKALIDRGFVDV